MARSVVDAIFFKILPTILGLGLMWIITSVNALQIETAKIDLLLTKNHEILEKTSIKMDALETKVVSSQIDVKVLETKLEEVGNEIDLFRQTLTGELDVTRDTR